MAKLTAEELKTALKADVGYTDEQLAGLTAPQLQKLADAFMRQSDYDRAMNEGKAELQKAQDELKAANDRLNAEMAEWATIQADGGKVTAKMQRDLESAQAKAAALTARVTAIATQAGLDPTKALEGLETTEPPKPLTPDLTGYIKADQLDAEINKRLGGLATGILDVPATIAAIQYDHQQLFGKPMTGKEVQAIVTEIKTRASTRGNQKSLDPTDIWSEQHKVPEAREAAEKKRWTDMEAAAEARGREAARSEMLIPGSTAAPGHRSVVFGEKGRTSSLQRPQPGTTVAKAAAAFRAGTYRKEGAGKPA